MLRDYAKLLSHAQFRSNQISSFSVIVLTRSPTYQQVSKQMISACDLDLWPINSKIDRLQENLKLFRYEKIESNRTISFKVIVLSKVQLFYQFSWIPQKTSKSNVNYIITIHLNELKLYVIHIGHGDNWYPSSILCLEEFENLHDLMTSFWPTSASVTSNRMTYFR